METPTVEMPSGEQALRRLTAGNRRFVDLKPMHPNQTVKRRRALIGGQHPLAVVLGCSDSRVPPEIIFDQGLGDLFVIRVAGNVVDEVVLASIEYATEHLHSPLLMVLGHSNCGAVEATINGGELEGHISSITSEIQQALDAVKDKPGDLLDNTIRAHARLTSQRLESSEPILAKLVDADKLKVVAAYYDLNTGIVEILS